jgi:hypothetical protein
MKQDQRYHRILHAKAGSLRLAGTTGFRKPLRYIRYSALKQLAGTTRPVFIIPECPYAQSLPVYIGNTNRWIIWTTSIAYIAPRPIAKSLVAIPEKAFRPGFIHAYVRQALITHAIHSTFSL